MKRIITIFICIVFVLLLVWLTLRQPVQSQPVDATKAPRQNSGLPPAFVAKQTNHQNAVSSVAMGTTNQLRVTQSKGEKIAQFLSLANHKDIEFYGTVTDQYGNPLVNVEVNGQVIFNTGLSSGVARPKTKTDSNGHFEIRGVKGRTLDFYLVKSGYEFMPEGDAFDYTELVPAENRHHPDPIKPVVLKMWKLHGAVSLIHWEDKYYVLPPDGAPVRIKLKTGKKTENGGDMVITLMHAESKHGETLQRFPWKAVLSLPGGGLIRSESRLMYEAPERGYDTITFEQNGTEQLYVKGADCNFYLKTGDGCYGRMHIHLNADPSPSYASYIMLTWWLNPKPGSRNLEFDPAKTANPAP